MYKNPCRAGTCIFTKIRVERVSFLDILLVVHSAGFFCAASNRAANPVAKDTANTIGVEMTTYVYLLP